MNFSRIFVTLKRGKVILRLASGILFILFAFFGIIFNDLYNKYSGLALVLVTMIYVYLTFELLVSTRATRSLPIINLEFVLTDKLSPEFIEEYSSYIIKSEDFNNSLSEYTKNSELFNKQLIFIKVENIGQTNILDLGIHIKYLKDSLSTKRESSRDIEFGILKVGAISLALVEVYDNPSSNDSFRLLTCESHLTDGNGKNMKEAPRYQDFSKTAISDSFASITNAIVFYNAR